MTASPQSESIIDDRVVSFDVPSLGKDAPADGPLLDAYSRAVINAVDAVGPSVVYIEVEQATRSGGRGSESGLERTGSGSGFIFTPDGFIITNSHVVHGAARIGVTLADGRHVAADLVGDDPDTDIAVIRIGASGLTAATLGDSRGEVIGVNTAIIRLAQGICFSIAINTAEFVASLLMRDGEVRRGYLGLGGQTAPIHRRVVRFYNLPVESGVLVLNTEEDGPARQAGLREGDVIVSFNGQPVGGIDDLHRLLTQQQVGVRSTIEVIRSTERLTMDVVPAPSPRRA
jgi:S1-C subfamily serine protease